ncbi:MAG: endonuclease/exonuclease/phosphatase family protein [Rhizobiaceae bacterium]|nr:endonuclease/exonuclease/phosphatase family protein [Rhizobiaceae bacterium]
MRFVSYNIRRCLGVDGVYSPDRIAAVLRECAADVIALQEVDVGRLRSLGVDQAEVIGNRLGAASIHFHPAIAMESEHYGDAILSMSSSRLVKAGLLPPGPSWRRKEPRGALWVEIRTAGRKVQVFNTHLGLHRKERLAQADALLGPEWIAQLKADDPLVLLGDFNSLPRGRVHSRLCARFTDAHHRAARGRPSPTFPTNRPLFRIDHIFCSPGIEVASAGAWRSACSRLASDHYPVFADLELGGAMTAI